MPLPVADSSRDRRGNPGEIFYLLQNNGRMIKLEMNHAGMFLYEHNFGAGREPENCH